eukprot:CAMPEP_0194307018 /NCGR_PEP_ID=MMETSP0171-20130528/3928_1 /TAXON_ID=218684 /ORGANISM="Corethron pennatum, Strain L29A3" /LENGTH=353 /DNA_ID=CAMNT_0039058891 /DNA_START=380 /DNA_END=1438 /DNA_ORIENTATION=+
MVPRARRERVAPVERDFCVLRLRQGEGHRHLPPWFFAHGGGGDVDAVFEVGEDRGADRVRADGARIVREEGGQRLPRPDLVEVAGDDHHLFVRLLLQPLHQPVGVLPRGKLVHPVVLPDLLRARLFGPLPLVRREHDPVLQVREAVAVVLEIQRLLHPALRRGGLHYQKIVRVGGALPQPDLQVVDIVRHLDHVHQHYIAVLRGTGVGQGGAVAGEKGGDVAQEGGDGGGARDADAVGVGFAIPEGEDVFKPRLVAGVPRLRDGRGRQSDGGSARCAAPQRRRPGRRTAAPPDADAREEGPHGGEVARQQQRDEEGAGQKTDAPPPDVGAEVFCGGAGGASPGEGKGDHGVDQ